MTENCEIWESILQGLPPCTSDEKLIPIPEIIKTIRFCLSDKIELYDVALSLLDLISPLRKDVEFLNWKALVEYEAKSYPRAFTTTEKLLTFIKNSSTLFNAGRAAYKANQLDKSEVYLKRAWDLEPLNSSFALDYAVTICAQGDFNKALEIIESIPKETLDPLHQKIVDFNKGWHYIRLGDFKEGIKHLHIGREINIWGSDARTYRNPKWDGTTEPGKIILIVGEGGIGDEVINARFSEIIQSRGMTAIMSTVHNNVPMLSSIQTLKEVFDSSEIDKKAWDYWVPCMDLPYVLDLEAADIPSNPYLKPNPEFLKKWQSIIHSDKFKVGIRWSGNPKYELELARTIDTRFFEEYLNSDNIQIYSLQKDDGVKNFKVPKGAIDLSAQLNTWDDTMAAVSVMDLVITSCTSIAHVAGALGQQTWVVVPLLPYYTWADMQKKSYWYDSVSVYRQKKHGEWVDPFIEIQRDVHQLTLR